MLCRVFYEDSASPSSNIETGAGEALKRDTSDRDGWVICEQSATRTEGSMRNMNNGFRDG